MKTKETSAKFRLTPTCYVPGSTDEGCSILWLIPNLDVSAPIGSKETPAIRHVTPKPSLLGHADQERPNLALRSVEAVSALVGIQTRRVTEQSFTRLAELCDLGEISAEDFEAIHAELTEILDEEAA